MTKHWITAPSHEGVGRYACHVFAHGESEARCKVFGKGPEEAKDYAKHIMAALDAIEDWRHLIRKSRKPLSEVQDWTLQRSEYESYFEGCERANKTPKTFDEWKAGNRE